MDTSVAKVFKYGPNCQQYGRLYPSGHGEKLPVIVIIHGGYYKENHNLDSYATKALIPYLLQFKLAVWNLEYRRMNSDGENTLAPWPTVFNDVATGIDFLSTIAGQENLDLNRVMLIGHSAGGHLAAWAASRGEISASSRLYRPGFLKISRVISIAGILNLTNSADLGQPDQLGRLMGGSFTQVSGRYQECDPNLLHGQNVPFLIIHGDQDKEVGISQAHEYCRRASDNTRLVVLPQGDHFSMLPLEGVEPKYWCLLKKLIAQEIKLLSS